MSDQQKGVGSPITAVTAIEEPENKRQRQRPALADIMKSRIVCYYQQILSAADMERYTEYFTKPLPTTIRVSSAGRLDAFQHAYSRQFGTLFRRFAIEDREETTNEQIIFSEIPWMNGGWSFTADRRLIRLAEHYKRLHRLLNLQHEAGFIVRQEAVSMIPPVFLQAQKGDSVLDLCAAPGSKTLQLLEDIGPTGLLIANDIDLKRCYILVHNTINVAMPSLAITNCDASRFPTLPDGMLFDRVLADVPCSGDGTLRKAPDIWSRWTPHNAIGLHPLQLRILLRALQLVKVGGTVVYSTCSLNPIENEAVVSAALQICRGSLEVLDASSIAPSLIRAPGITSWSVIDPVSNETLGSVEDTQPTSRGNIYHTMFPCSLLSSEVNADEVFATIHLSNLRACDQQISTVHGRVPLGDDITMQLKRTMRFYPWLQDTGGFYVALLQLSKPLPDPESNALLKEVSRSAAEFADNQLNLVNADKIMRPPRGVPPPMWQDLPMVPLQDPSIIDIVRQEYGLPEHFLAPYVPVQRQPDKASRVIMISDKLARVFLNNSERNYQTIFRIVIAGCGCFQRQSGNEKFRNTVDGSNLWRIPQSSVPFLLTNVSSCKRVLPPMPYNIFMLLLKTGLDSEDTNDQTVLFTDLEQTNPEYIKTVSSLGVLGHTIITVDNESDAEGLDKDGLKILDGILFSGWIGGHSLGLHVQKRQRAALYEVVSGVNIKVGPSRAARQKAAKRERAKCKRQEGQAGHQQGNNSGRPDSETE